MELKQIGFDFFFANFSANWLFQRVIHQELQLECDSNSVLQSEIISMVNDHCMLTAQSSKFSSEG